MCTGRLEPLAGYVVIMFAAPPVQFQITRGGTTVDLTLNGLLDRRGDNQVQLGLTLIASIFNAHGWFWGAAFRTEDALHFEASRSLISQWPHFVMRWIGEDYLHKLTICTNLFSRNGRRKLLGLFALVVAAFMLPVFAEAACSFELPATWRTKTALWVGDCKAEGPSVVKETSDGKVVRFFFGRIQTGKWVLGVIDQSDGYLAGEFLNGPIDGQVERSVMIRAFDE